MVAHANLKKLPVQNELALIPHAMDNAIVPQRKCDGYINASIMCKIANKLFADWYGLTTTNEFLQELSWAECKDVNALIIIRHGVTQSKTAHGYIPTLQ